MSYKRKMTLFVEILKSNNESIFSPSEITPELMTANTVPDLASLNSYQMLEQAYHNQGVFFHRQHLLKKLAKQFSVLTCWNYYKSYRLLNEISSLLHLNQFEVAYWSLLLDYNSSTLIRPVISAYFTGYQAKCYMNNDVSSYKHRMNIKIPNFKLLYCNWLLVCDREPEFTLRQICSKYSKLIKKNYRNDPNYEKMINKLMEGSRRKESPVQLSDSSKKFEVMQKELELFQKEFLQGDILSPIGDL